MEETPAPVSIFMPIKYNSDTLRTGRVSASKVIQKSSEYQRDKVTVKDDSAPLGTIASMPTTIMSLLGTS